VATPTLRTTAPVCPAGHIVFTISFALGLEYAACPECGLRGWARGGRIVQREEVYPLLREIWVREASENHRRAALIRHQLRKEASGSL
jgi:hypothetical protein